MEKTKISELKGDLLLSMGIYPIDDDSYYRDILNDVYDSIKIGNLEYGAGQVLQEVDPVAFRCSKNDYFDSLKTDEVVCEIDGNYYRIDVLKAELEKHGFELE